MQDIDLVSNVELSTLLKSNMASVYKKEGDFKTALDWYFQVYKQADKVHDKAEALKNIAGLQYKLGEPKKALESVNSAIKLFGDFSSMPYTKSIKDKIIIAKGTILLDNKDFKSLDQYFKEYSSFFKDQKTFQTIYFHELKAKAELAQNKLSNAEQSIAIASKIVDYNNEKESGPKVLKLGQVLLTKFEIQQALGKQEEASETLNGLLNLLNFNFETLEINVDSKQNLEVVTKALLEWIEILKLEKSKNNEKIFKLYLEIFRIQKRSYSIAVNESYEQFWAQSNMEIISGAIKYFMENENFAYVFQLMEMNKSNLLIESISDSEAKGKARVPKQYLNEELEYLANINFYESKVKKLEKDSSYSSEILKMQEAISINQLKLENLKDSLEVLFPDYYSIKYKNDHLTVKDIQSKLVGNEAFIEYFVGDDLAIAATISQNEFEIIEFDFDEELLNSLSEFAAQLREPKKEFESFSKESNVIYSKLLGPILKTLPEKTNSLIIVQDGMLSNLPFSVLENEKGDYVMSHYNTSYQYSARLWNLLLNKENENYSYDWTGFAYDVESENVTSERDCANLSNASLLCSKREITEIGNLFQDQVGTSQKLDLENFLDKAEHSKIIHLATHSCLDHEDYGQSRIYFNDSYMTYNDIQLNTFDVELAVVSSCESGYGKVIEGEGAMSIAKAFFQAGAKSTLVSLWPVDDCSTADIMSYFYQNLKEDDNKSEALSKAKLKYLETAHPSRTHPYYWAGFVLIGNDQSVLAQAPALTKFYYLGFSVLLVGVFLFLRRK